MDSNKPLKHFEVGDLVHRFFPPQIPAPIGVVIAHRLKRGHRAWWPVIVWSSGEKTCSSPVDTEVINEA